MYKAHGADKLIPNSLETGIAIPSAVSMYRIKAKDGLFDGDEQNKSLTKVIEEKGFKCLQNQITYIKSLFDQVINNLVSKHDLHAIYHIDTGFNLSYDQIKKYSGWSKYRKAHFKEENEMNPHEEILADLGGSKMLFKYFMEVHNPHICEIKTQYKQALKCLLEARDMIIRNYFDHF